MLWPPSCCSFEFHDMVNITLSSTSTFSQTKSQSIATVDFILKNHSLLVLFILIVMVFWISPSAHAAPTLTISPPSQTASQASTASYTVSLNGGAANATYALTMSGLPAGVGYSFSPSTIGASGSSLLAIQKSTSLLYCPGSYSFTVTATNVAVGSDRASASATLIVTQAGPPLSVSVSTDKSAYTTNENVTIYVSINAAAEGTLTASPPSGAPTAFHYQYASSASFTKSFSTANQPTGRWTVTLQADDYCGGSSSAVAYFDLVADTYPVSISLSGIPSSVLVIIQVDGQNQGSMGGSETKSLSFKVGTQHSISVDQYVKGDTGVRYFDSQNSWSVGSAGSHTFTYVAQYYFTVGTNPDGLIQISGAGWYSAGSQFQEGAPQIINNPASAPYSFSRWELDGVPQLGNPITITMDKPHTAMAVYQVSAVTTIVFTSTSAQTSTTSVTSTTVATGTTSSTSIVTQTGSKIVSNFITSGMTTEQTTTIFTFISQTLTSTLAIMQFEDPNLEVGLGSILIVSALVIVITLVRRSMPRKQIACGNCGFRNPPAVTSFCVNCGQSLKGGRSR